MNTAKANANDIKHQLRKRQGLTLRGFAERYGFKYDAVSAVVRGIRQGNYGEGRDIAEKLEELLKEV